MVSGTLTIEVDPSGGPAGVTGSGSAELHAEGLVVRTPDGEEATLEPIRVISECWGCFAG